MRRLLLSGRVLYDCHCSIRSNRRNHMCDVFDPITACTFNIFSYYGNLVYIWNVHTHTHKIWAKLFLSVCESRAFFRLWSWLLIPQRAHTLKQTVSDSQSEPWRSTDWWNLPSLWQMAVENNHPLSLTTQGTMQMIAVHSKLVRLSCGCLSVFRKWHLTSWMECSCWTQPNDCLPKRSSTVLGWRTLILISFHRPS